MDQEADMENKDTKKVCELCGGTNICPDCGRCIDCGKCDCKKIENSGGAE